MTTINFRVPGKPLAKGRPRFTRGGHVYTPEATAEYENLVKLCFLEQAPDWVPSDKPVTMTVWAWYPIPESWSKKKKQLALDHQISPGKPDWDNVGKIISDALNGVAYVDDSQICFCTIVKSYGEVPEVRVELIFET